MSPTVFLYALSTCGHCRNTKEFLNSSGVKYDHVDVDLLQGEERRRVIEEVKKHNPALSFPTVLIGDKVIIGFKKEDIQKALGL